MHSEEQPPVDAGDMGGEGGPGPDGGEGITTELQEGDIQTNWDEAIETFDAMNLHDVMIMNSRA